MKILICGATGLIGKKLVLKLLEQNHEIKIITRNKEHAFKVFPKGCEFIEADLMKSPLSFGVIEGVDVLINLVGESIAGGYWTSSRKNLIYKSRIDTTRNLIASLKNFPKIYIGASAVGYYGDAQDSELNEQSNCGQSYLAQVCHDWEVEHEKIKLMNPQTRCAILRFGVVLSKEGGFLDQLTKIFKLNIGSVLGDGKQWLSWISLEDLISGIIFIINHSELSGPINMVSPSPVTNRQFTEALSKHLNKITLPAVPAFILKALLGDLSELMLSSQKVKPEKLLRHNFEFKRSDLGQAFK